MADINEVLVSGELPLLEFHATSTSINGLIKCRALNSRMFENLADGITTEWQPWQSALVAEALLDNAERVLLHLMEHCPNFDPAVYGSFLMHVSQWFKDSAGEGQTARLCEVPDDMVDISPQKIAQGHSDKVIPVNFAKKRRIVVEEARPEKLKEPTIKELKALEKELYT